MSMKGVIGLETTYFVFPSIDVGPSTFSIPSCSFIFQESLKDVHVLYKHWSLHTLSTLSSSLLIRASVNRNTDVIQAHSRIPGQPRFSSVAES